MKYLANLCLMVFYAPYYLYLCAKQGWLEGKITYLRSRRM